jgi:hypothetical protein
VVNFVSYALQHLGNMMKTAVLYCNVQTHVV